MIVAAISIGIATRLKSSESRRIAARLFVSAGIYGMLNLVLLAFRSNDNWEKVCTNERSLLAVNGRSIYPAFACSEVRYW